MRGSLVAVLVLVTGCTTGALPSAPPSPTDTTLPSPTASAGPPTPTASPGASPTTTPGAIVGAVVEVRSDAERRPMDAATPEQLAELVAADTDFGLRLYQQIVSSEQGNVFISPYSISTALSMAYAGARGNTAQEMAEVMGIWPDEVAWHAARNRLDLELAALRLRTWPGQGVAMPMTLEPVNTIFGQVGYPFEQPFLDTLAADYGAGLQTVDFAGATEEARLAINDWVAQRTRDRIEDLLRQGDVTDITVFALVNAIYFKASWQRPFNPDLTAPGPFHLRDGTTREVSMMHGGGRLVYAEGDGWQAVRLPYFGASMLVLVPEADRFEEIEAELDRGFLRIVTDGLHERTVTLSLPRWESESRANLVEKLEALGIIDLFIPAAADLSGISRSQSPFVSKVIHQANVTVDEAGTEAAAATAVIGGFVSAGPEPAILRADRPFLYFIQDDVAGEILFMGRLLEP